MSSFTEHFWGEKNNGFDVLYHNMKHGQDSSKEFADFLRESCTAEETYARLLAKLANNANKYGSKGSFSLYWQTVKSFIEKLSNLHLQLVYTWQDLMKDVQRYTEEQHKKHKSMKDSESATLEIVQSIQQTIVSVQKAKESYHARCLEYEKLRRDSNSSPKDLEKAETKFKKATDEYQSLVEKYSNVRNDFETRMLDSCKKFQELEEHHLAQMKDFVDTYAKAWEHQHVLLGQVHQEFSLSNKELAVDYLIQNFIQTKTTGIEKPGPIEFVEADLSSLPAIGSTPDLEKKDIPVLDKPKKEGGDGGAEVMAKIDPPPTAMTKSSSSSLLDGVLPRNTGWFLSKRRREKKKKKKKEAEEKEKEDGANKNSPKVDEDGYHVDEEGYRIRPNNDTDQVDRDSWYSTSDSDSDGEEKRKIKVEIKPLSSPNGAGTNNVDDLEKAVGGLRLSPTTTRRATPTLEMKKSMSFTEPVNNSKPSEDLLGLDLFGTSAFTSPASNNTSVLSESSDGATAATSRQQRSQTPSALPLLTGPPPPRTARTQLSTGVAKARPSGRQSPAPNIERTDSVPSLNSVSFNTSMSFGSSRGPSPLTIGMADTIPLAVSYSERVNSLFKGMDESKCKVKITGEMVISFPAGIVRVLTENPNPALLTFSIKNTTRIHNILVNKQLIKEESSASDNTVYSFDMSVLTDHLRRQTEQNKSASYFNIDILKYEIRCLPGVASVPLHLVSYWKCDSKQTSFRLDYTYNAASMAVNVPLSNVTVLLPVDGHVTNMMARPSATWIPDNNRAVWRLGEISEATEERGCLRAKFDVSAGPSTPSQAAVQFLCEGHTLSGVDFELLGSGYRVSLVKKRFITGKYISETDNSVFV